MKTRQLPSQRRLQELLDYNPQTGQLFWKARGIPTWDGRCADKEAFTAKTPAGYKRGLIDGVQYRAHRVIYKLMTDQEPEEIDHINRIRDDNRICNLRPSTRRENLLNAAPSDLKATLGENHLSKTPNGWECRISVRNQSIYLGNYRTKEEARAAVEGALRLLAKGAA